MVSKCPNSGVFRLVERLLGARLQAVPLVVRESNFLILLAWRARGSEWPGVGEGLERPRRASDGAAWAG